MYTCRCYGRWIFYYIVSSFELANELWSTEQAYSANSLIYMVVLSESYRAIRALGREWKESLRNSGNSFRVVYGERIDSRYERNSSSYIARATLRFISRNSSRWSHWPGMGQDNWPLPEKRLSENNADRRWKATKETKGILNGRR